MHKIKQALFPQLFIIYTRYIIGGAFVFASIIKIKGQRFTRESGETFPIHSAWYFFETMYQSGRYWQFIGVCQLLAGLLLMTQRFSKLGALCYFPIILNIFIITLSYSFHFTPVITGLMLLANILLLLWDWNTLKMLCNLPFNIDNTITMEKDILWQLLGVILFSFTFLYRLLFNDYHLITWFIVCLTLGLIGLIIGIYRETKRVK